MSTIMSHDDSALCAPVPALARALEKDELYEGHFSVAGGLRLYRCYLPARVSRPGDPVLIILHGYGDHCRRYDELSSYLAERGISVARYDARGHGQSEGQRGFIESFEHYVDDLCVFFDSVVRDGPERSVGLLGHSNGGLVTLLAVSRGALSPAALVLSNPLVELHERRRPVPDWLAALLSRAAPRLSLPSGIKARHLTRDPELERWIERDPLVHRVVTPRWYWSVLGASKLALAQAPRVQMPSLVIASERDSLVEPRSVRLCYARLGARDKQLLVRLGARHEALHEVDRHEVFAAVAGFLERRLAPAETLVRSR